MNAKDVAQKIMEDSFDPWTMNKEQKQYMGAFDLDEAESIIAAALAEKDAEIARLSQGLRIIRDFPDKDYPRRTEDGYPTEFAYDEFAYRRIIDGYRKVARDFLLPDEKKEEPCNHVFTSTGGVIDDNDGCALCGEQYRNVRK